MPFYRRPDGCRLYFELHGEPSSEPLALLEGLGGDIPGWGRHVEALARELRAIAFDFRGNGRSDKPDEPQTMRTFVEDTVGLLDHIGVESSHVYGQSFGGMVAQELTLTRPERVRSLILAATHPGVSHAVKPRSKVPKDRPWLALYSPAFVRDQPERLGQHRRVAHRNPQPSHAARRQWEAMREFDSYDRLPRVRVPTLILHGAQDLTIDPENARVLAERIPGSRLVMLDGAGHVYHWERPDEASRVVLEFVREVSAGR
ncbi:MAG TPA: alpha/beta fold hydrolase [Actinomycetota bacterium]|nr:alpha/beta fold hydrolase [Actinomycetota bacterium]